MTPAAIQERIESVLSRLRKAAGPAWVEPVRVRFELTGKYRPGSGPGSMRLAVTFETDTTEFAIVYDTADIRRKGDSPRERVTTRARA